MPRSRMPAVPATTEATAARIAAACRRIEGATELPSLAELATQAGLSTFQFHRLFKAATGLTPKQYADAYRARRVRDALSRADAKVTDAIFDAGFNATGRFYEQAGAVLGMTPRQ